MGRWIILGIVVVVAITLYAVVDCAMTDNRRTRIFQKPIWLIIVLLLPIIGPGLWIMLGKGNVEQESSNAPDDDESYLQGLRGASLQHDARIRELEDEMRKLDEEIEQSRRASMNEHPSNHTGANPVISDDEPHANGDTIEGDDDASGHAPR